MSIFHHEPGTEAAAAAVALPAPPAAAETAGGSRPLAIAASVGAAIAGGLLWAGVVIATNYDIGILAWFVGACTGLALARVAGGAVGTVERALAGTLAAGAIVLGKYVIFVHALKVALRDTYHLDPSAVGYFDSREMSVFVHNVGDIFRPIYVLWLALAFVGAFRASGGGGVLPRRRQAAGADARASK